MEEKRGIEIVSSDGYVVSWKEEERRSLKREKRET